MVIRFIIKTLDLCSLNQQFELLLSQCTYTTDLFQIRTKLAQVELYIMKHCETFAIPWFIFGMLLSADWKAPNSACLHVFFWSSFVALLFGFRSVSKQ